MFGHYQPIARPQCPTICSRPNHPNTRLPISSATKSLYGTAFTIPWLKPGDRLIIYETGDHKSAVGTATVVSVDASNPKNPAVEIKAGKPLANVISLAQIKSNRLFADSPLVRQGRLSVVPLNPAQYKFLTGD